MATQKNVRNIWTCIKKSSARRYNRRFFKNVGSYVMNFIFVIILICIACVSVVCMYNPIMFPLWVLIFYKSDWAEQIYGSQENEIDRILQDLYRDILHWEIKLFPLWMKGPFVIVAPKCFSISDQVRTAQKLKETKADFVGKMSEAAVQELWIKGDDTDRYAIAATRRSLDMNILNFLLEHGDVKELTRLVQQTPMKECVAQLMASCEDEDTDLDKISQKILKVTIFKHGLDADLISKAYDSKNRSLRDTVASALNERNQYQMILKLRDANMDNELLWEKFCAENADICESSQKLMSYWMFDEFYSSGHYLSEKAQIYFFTAENLKWKDDIVRCIFQNEKNFSDRIMSVIQSNPKLYTLYLQR